MKWFFWKVRYAFWFWHQTRVTFRVIWGAANANDPEWVDDATPREAVETELSYFTE